MSTPIREIAAIRFRDRESLDGAVVIVRQADRDVGLCVSLRSDGDVEVFFDTVVAEQLLNAIREAIELARRPT
jgi:hypothetical protein